MKLSKTVSVIILFIITLHSNVYTESAFYSDYEKGKEAYLNNQYDMALTYFENALSGCDPEYEPVLYYWSGQSNMALGNYSKADNIFNVIVEKYPGTAEAVNSVYQKGRILFIENDYEKSIEKMHTFLEKSGENRLNGNAYFWIGESLFYLGHKDKALSFYKKVIYDYPESYKYEASNYRAELINLGKKEDELLKLLKWSHEESLNERELFIKKEKEYKQALLAYQRKLAILSDNEISNEVLTLRETNSVLKKQIAVLQDKLKLQEKEIEILKNMNNDNKDKSDNPVVNKTETSEPVNEEQ